MALEGIRFIAQHIKDADKDNEVIFLEKNYFIYDFYKVFSSEKYNFNLGVEKKQQLNI